MPQTILDIALESEARDNLACAEACAWARERGKGQKNADIILFRREAKGDWAVYGLTELADYLEPEWIDVCMDVVKASEKTSLNVLMNSTLLTPLQRQEISDSLEGRFLVWLTSHKGLARWLRSRYAGLSRSLRDSVDTVDTA